MDLNVEMTIGGELRTGSDRFEVINPATGLAFAHAPVCSEAELNEAFVAAAKAQRAWAKDDGARRDALRRAADAIAAAEDRIALVLSAEQGKPVRDAAGEVRNAVMWFRFFADLEVPAEEVLSSDTNHRRIAIHKPLGVVAAITPWNFPITLTSWKLAPALRAGNAVVLKPSPYTPLATLILGEVLNTVLPPGSVNVVSGGDALGAAMTAHPVPRKLSFTGSTRAGRMVAAAAGDDLKRLTLELGGNDAAIVLEDVDIAAAAEMLFWRSFYNNGQVCGCIKRIYVHRSRHDELVSALVAIAARVKVGDGALPDTVLGPVNNRMQYDKLRELLADALANGATAACGGLVPEGPGYFLPPTILTGVADGHRIVDEEQFGPILPIVPFDDLDALVERVNDSSYGLGGSVWGSDPTRLGALARRLESGSIWINTHGMITPNDPFGGAKLSGIGVEGGVPGLRSFSQLHVVHEPVAN